MDVCEEIGLMIKFFKRRCSSYIVGVRIKIMFREVELELKEACTFSLPENEFNKSGISQSIIFVFDGIASVSIVTWRLVGLGVSE